MIQDVINNLICAKHRYQNKRDVFMKSGKGNQMLRKTHIEYRSITEAKFTDTRKRENTFNGSVR